MLRKNVKLVLNFLLFSLIVLNWSCQKDDEMPTLPSCPDGRTYALDYRTAQFSGNTIWLTNTDGELVLNEEVPGGAATPYFVNLEKACSDVYTLSTAGYPTMSNGNPQVFAHNFQIREFGSVPQGSAIDFWNGLNATLFGYLPEGTIYIEDCPPVDSVRLLSYSDPREGYGSTARFSFEYSAEDNLLAIRTMNTALWVTDLQLAVRTLDGAWAGMWFPASSFVGLPPPRSYAQLEPMRVLQTTIEWPTNAREAELEVFWVQDAINRRVQIIGKTDSPGVFELPFPANIDGPFLFHFRWKDEYEREIKTVEERWPGGLSFFPTLEGQLVDYQYPQLHYESVGANILKVDGIYEDPNSSAYCRRQYEGPIAGDGTINFAPFSPSLDQASSRLKVLYETTWDQELIVDFYYYPAMTGFDWYLRNVVSDLGSGQSWLERQVYERLTLPQ